jgi:hypothetical protein
MDSFVIFEWEEVSPVSGDDEIGFAGNCTSEDVVVGKIVFDDVRNDFRCVWSSGGDGAPCGLHRGVLMVDPASR